MCRCRQNPDPDSWP